MLTCVCDQSLPVNVNNDAASSASGSFYGLTSASCRNPSPQLVTILYAGTMRTFSLLPLGVFFVGFEAALRPGLVVSVEAKQQCRLQRNNLNIQLPSPIIGTSATGRPPTSTPSGSISSTTQPSSTPFNYGSEPIRGVNMYVSIVSRAIFRHS